MTKKETAYAYLQHLGDGKLEALLSLFSEGAQIESPVYGQMSASDFYTQLFSDTTQSVLRLRGLFEDAESGRVALYFSYGWTLADGQEVNFDVVDILEFDPANRISRLKIIYDTIQSRAAVARLEKE
jgi:hypothetical protein